MSSETIAILGGSSAFTPALALWLANGPTREHSLEIRLVGRSASRTESVANCCQALAAEGRAPHRYVATTSEPSGVAGADIVFLAFRPGGFRARAKDEEWCAAHSIPYDETIGPGGLFGAMRAADAVLRSATIAASLGNSPLVVNLVNPMSILLAHLRNHLKDVEVIGLCELPEVTIRRCLESLGLSPETEVAVAHRGVNHQGWILGIEDREGRDLLRSWRSRPISSDGLFAGVAARPLDEVGLPLSYMRLHRTEGREAHLEAHRRRAAGRGAELEDLAERLHGIYRTGGDPRPLLARRDTRWYDHAVGPLIASRLSLSSQRLWISAPQAGLDPDLPENAILEQQVLAEGPRWERPAPAPRYPEHTSFLKRIVAFDEAAAASVREPTPEKLNDALGQHPWDLPASLIEAATQRILDFRS